MSRSVFSDAYGSLLDALVEARKAAGLRQVDLANRLRKTQSFVSKMENGERRLDVIEFMLVTKAIGIDPLALLAAIWPELPNDERI